MEEISVKDYAQMRDKGEEHLLLDVREADEILLCAIEGHVHIPMNEIPNRMMELDGWRNKAIICQCRSGHRSRTVGQYLSQHGFGKVYNLTGGILAWGEEIDPSIQAY